MTNASRALIIGGTGLVGSELLKLLLEDARFEGVVSLGRRPSGLTHPKLREELIDFRKPETWPKLEGDVLFSTLGTTRSAAGGKEAQREVDYTFQYRVAERAAESGVGTLVLVSSAGADENSVFFYPKIKGELDRDVERLPFARVRILRPSFLDGDRKEKRAGEGIGLAVLSVLRFVPGLAKARPIHARTVAAAMIAAALQKEPRVTIYRSDELFALPAQ